MNTGKVDTQEKPFRPAAERKTTTLCQLCRQEPHCTFQSQPHLHGCEEFDSLPRDPLEVITSYMSFQKNTRKDMITTDENLRGLCKTCSIAEGCTFPRHESGVWHCEEYK